MGTKQHFVLFEHVTGYSIFLVKEFCETDKINSAHVNSIIKSVAFVPFNSVADALDNIQAISDSRPSNLLIIFLRQNMPIKDAVLGVADKLLGEAILNLNFGFECIWTQSIKEIIRTIRTNSARLLRSLIAKPLKNNSSNSKLEQSNNTNEITSSKISEQKSRLIIALSRARLQLDLVQHLADTGVVRSLNLLDKMDASLGQSIKRLRSSYTIHFPELCRRDIYQLNIDDFTFIQIVSNFPSRELITPSILGQLTEWTNDEPTSLKILYLASTSTGQPISEEDLHMLQAYANYLLRLLKSRTNCCQMLEDRVRNLLPNLTALMDKAMPYQNTENIFLERMQRVGDSVSSVFVVARLLSHAVNLDKLAKMPSSRIHSLGASKSLFIKSGAISATSVGLLGKVATSGLENSNKSNLCNEKKLSMMTGGVLRPFVVRRRIARILAAKSALACRVDCYRKINPFKEPSSSTLLAPDTDSGTYGSLLGEEVNRQLRVWAEAKGVKFDQTDAAAINQRIQRKKYRKRKRKAWLSRKSKASHPHATTKPFTDQPILFSAFKENCLSNNDQICL